MAANSINFFQPGTDAAVDANQIARQRQLADMLMKQGQATPQGQMVSGHFVAPGAGSYIAQLASALGGRFANQRADDQERDLVKSLQASRAKEASDFMAAMNGSPGRTIQPLTPNDDEGNPMPAAQAEAVAPDRARAMAIALQSQNPQMQAMGGELMKRQMDAAELSDALNAAGISRPGGGGAGAGVGTPQGAAGGMPQASGIPAGVNPQALALMLSKNAQANKLGGVIQDLAKPQVLAEGGTLLERGANGAFAPSYIAPKTEAGIAMNRGPGGMTAGAIPGFADARGQIAGAEAQARQTAESANTMVTIDTPQGPRMMTRAQALQLSGGGQPQSAGMPNLTEAAMGRNAVINDNPSADAAREIAALRSDLAKVPDAASKKMIQNEIDRLSGQVQKYGAGGGRGTINPPPGPGIALQSEEQKAYGTTRAKDFAGQAAAYQKSGSQSASTLRNLDELRTLYSDPNVAKGALAENISGLKNMGASFGIDMKGLSSEQAAAAITNKMALDLRSTADGGGMPGAMSDADREFLKALTPNLTKSPEGRAKIMDAQEKVARRNLEIARMANQYEQQNGRIDAGFDKVVQDFASKNKMFAAPASGGFKIIGVR